MRKTANQIADAILVKIAAEPITDDDITAGIAGYQRRPISQADVNAYIGAENQAAQENTQGRTGRGALWGTGIGAGVGSAAGAIGGRTRVGGGLRGLALGALLGAGTGALSGGISGHLERSRADRDAQFYGQVAQQGKLPYNIPSGIDLEDVRNRAIGIHENMAEDIDPEDYEELRGKLRKHLIRRRAIENAAAGAMAYSGMPTDENSENQSADTLAHMAKGALIHGGLGAMEGNREAREQLKVLTDLRERGYGHLASRLENQSMRGAFEDY